MVQVWETIQDTSVFPTDSDSSRGGGSKNDSAEGREAVRRQLPNKLCKSTGTLQRSQHCGSHVEAHAPLHCRQCAQA